MKLHQIALLVLMLLGSAAFARSPASVTVGEKKVVKVSMPIASVRSSDSSTLRVKKLRAKEIEVRGEQPGRATVLMKTAAGISVSLDIHVVSEGSRVYSANR